jgi:hypothetical protein
LDGRMILKRTHWYAMNTPAGFDFLVPQLEEDILDASWCDAQEVFENRKNTYGNIALILDAMDEEVL